MGFFISCSLLFPKINLSEDYASGFNSFNLVMAPPKSVKSVSRASDSSKNCFQVFFMCGPSFPVCAGMDETVAELPFTVCARSDNGDGKHNGAAFLLVIVVCWDSFRSLVDSASLEIYENTSPGNACVSSSGGLCINQIYRLKC